jgi:hypothetical protein
MGMLAPTASANVSEHSRTLREKRRLPIIVPILLVDINQSSRL